MTTKSNLSVSAVLRANAKGGVYGARGSGVGATEERVERSSRSDLMAGWVLRANAEGGVYGARKNG